MAPFVRKNSALFMPHVRSSSRAPPSLGVMNSAAPSALRVPSVNHPLVFEMKKAFSVTRRAVQCRSSRRLHRGAPHPTANLFFPPLPFLSLAPLLVFILHLIAVLSRILPSASYPLPPALPPSPSASAATGEEERERERGREKSAAERERHVDSQPLKCFLGRSLILWRRTE